MRKKSVKFNVCVSLTLFLSILSCSNSETKYFDQNMVEVDDPMDASFKRIQKPDGDLYSVEDYYIDGGLQFKGYMSNLVQEKFEGVCTWYFKNGNKSILSRYVDGVPQGETIVWYENGTKKGEMYFTDGELDGRYRGYYDNSQLMAEIHFDDGEPQADVANIYYQKDGDKLYEVEINKNESSNENLYREDGTLFLSIMMNEDDEPERWTYHYPNGEISDYVDEGSKNYNFWYKNGVHGYRFTGVRPEYFFGNMFNDGIRPENLSRDYTAEVRNNSGSTVLSFVVSNGRMTKREFDKRIFESGVLNLVKRKEEIEKDNERVLSKIREEIAAIQIILENEGIGY